MQNDRISVVVPCFNEAKTIHRNLKKIYSHLNPRFGEFEIIAVNDGSVDDTLGEIKKTQEEIPVVLIDNANNKGKGKAIRDGMLAARYEISMFLDADLGIPIEELDKFITEIKKGSDLVIASRLIPGFRAKRPVLWYRRIMEKVFRLMRIAIINQRDIKDTQCGFKVFRRSAVEKIFPKTTTNRFAFDAEVTYLANKFGYKVKELPVSLHNPPETSVRLMRDPMNMAFDLVRIRLNGWKGKYD